MNLKSLTLILAALLAATALAGCADDADPVVDDTTGDDVVVPDDTPPADETPDENETLENETVEADYVLTTSGIPAIVAAGNDFTFTMEVAGPAGTSDHLGAHIANSAEGFPAPGARLDCEHVTDAVLPGTFTVTCVVPEGNAGEWFVFGHMQTLVGDERVNWWAEPEAITVYDYNTTIGEVSVENNTGTFTVTVEGAPEFNSTHAGAHFTTEPVTGVFTTSEMGGCTHGNQVAPGAFTVTCEFPEAGTYYVYGHYRVQEGDAIEDFWSAPLEVTVA